MTCNFFNTQYSFADATCANAGPATISPLHSTQEYWCYTIINNILSLSVAIPTSSRPIFSILDFIPTAESKISDSIISSFPLDLTDAKTLFFFQQILLG